MPLPETKGDLLRVSLHFALGRIKLAGYKLSDRDRELAAADTIYELQKHGQWKELNDPIEIIHRGFT